LATHCVVYTKAQSIG